MQQRKSRASTLYFTANEEPRIGLPQRVQTQAHKFPMVEHDARRRTFYGFFVIAWQHQGPSIRRLGSPPFRTECDSTSRLIEKLGTLPINKERLPMTKILSCAAVLGLLVASPSAFAAGRGPRRDARRGRFVVFSGTAIQNERPSD